MLRCIFALIIGLRCMSWATVQYWSFREVTIRDNAVLGLESNNGDDSLPATGQHRSCNVHSLQSALPSKSHYSTALAR